MTREEAIDIILNDVNTHTIREGIALNMAIEALGQEPILDKIRAEIKPAGGVDLWKCQLKKHIEYYLTDWLMLLQNMNGVWLLKWH